MLSENVLKNLKNASWIRAMFEEGERLRSLHGDDKVFDFTLGNPDHEPPKSVKDSLKEIVLGDKPGIHRYMNNAGYADVRQKVADHINNKNNTNLQGKHIIMTCGAAGGLNVVLKSILNPGEEVIILAPFFPEYIFYVGNHGGKPIIVPPTEGGFEPNLKIFEESINQNTKAVILNSPNNPSGYVYSKKTLMDISQILSQKEKQYGTSICILSDEPYNELVYDGIELPSILNIFKNSFIINSFSKSLALPGERIGYIAVNPHIPDIESAIESLVFCNRTLGMLMPPTFQKVISESLDEDIDIGTYETRRNMMYNNLTNLGFTCFKPMGAFYFFPQSPIKDDIKFVNDALKYNLLLVPGTGFGLPGHFRISYCVNIETIKNSFDAFASLGKDYKLKINI